MVSLSVLTALLVGIISHYRYKQTIIKESHEKLQLLVESNGKELEKQIEFIEAYSLVLESVLKRTFDWEIANSDKAFDNYAKRVIPLLDTIALKFRPLSYWMIFNPEYFEGGHTISFIDKSNTGNYVRESEYNVNDFDLNSKEMEWWVDGMKYGKTWTRPYYWKNWDIQLLTYAKAVEIDGKKIAVVGSDIDFNKFKRDIATRKIYKTGYFWLFNNELEFILHPTLEGIKVKDIKDKKLVDLTYKLLNANDKGISDYVYLNVEKVLAFYKLSNGWYLFSGVPKDEIFADLDETSRINTFIIIFGVFIAIVIGLLISNSISKPVEQLVRTIKKGSDGDYSVRAKIKSNDEFNTLGNYFNFFMEKLEQTVLQLKINEQHLIDAKNKAEESDRLKSAFLANLSHEIRTPMNAILGFSSLLSEEDIDKSSKTKYIQLIHNSTNDLLYILTNIIDFSIIEAKQLPLENRPYSLNKLLQSVHEHYKSELLKLDKEKIELLLESNLNTNNEHFVIGDRGKIHQVFSSLLSNSMKFTSEGYIKIGCMLKESDILFFVEDTGIGLSIEEQTIVFKRFLKGKNATLTTLRGVGLGLTISKKLIEIMKGDIWLESAESKGTKVFFTVPHNPVENITK